MPQTQSYPRLLSQVQAEAHAQVEGLYDPTRCEALAKCDAFAKKVFEFVCVRVAAMLVARPGGHPMKPLKLDMAPHLPRRKEGALWLIFCQRCLVILISCGLAIDGMRQNGPLNVLTANSL